MALSLSSVHSREWRWKNLLLCHFELLELPTSSARPACGFEPVA
jgi:hypothetical protein